MAVMSTIGQTVHILPLGFEVERALVPFAEYVPNRVILVIQGNDGTPRGEDFYTEQQRYTALVRESLESRGVRVEVMETNTFVLDLFIRDLSRLIRREKEASNTVCINASSSGRFASIAAAIAGMAQDIEVYYVPAVGFAMTEKERREFGVSRCSPSTGIWKFDNYRFVLPKEEEALVLEYLYLAREELHEPAVSLKEIGRLLHAAFPDRYPWVPLDEQPKKYYKQQKGDAYEQYRHNQSKFTIRFKTALADDMTAQQYLERVGGERKRVFYRITPTGEYALFLYGISGKIVERNGKLVYDASMNTGT
ncbi:MAG TPA: DUF6293 family protein [Methanocorpusculum sp.]|nr:DUF6293 family protein [Methanocorpusculum sp.]